MEWKDFIVPIRKAGVSCDASYKILRELFEKAGSIKISEVSDSAVKSWLSGGRNCKVSTHFPKGTINTEQVFKYFSGRDPIVLERLQQEYRNNEKATDSPIDIKTDNMNIFCWSLVNQFLDLLGLQRIDIPDNPTLPGNESARTSQLCDKCCLYCMHWQGDKSTVGPNRMPTSGICVVNLGKNRQRLQRRLSSSAVCANYQADQNLISNMKRAGYNVESIM